MPIRRQLRVAAIVSFALAGLIAGCHEQPASHIRSEHHAAASAPKPLADEGPPAAVYRAAWHRDLGRAAGDGSPAVVPRLLAGNVVVWLGDGVQAYDARTGRPTWRYVEPGRAVRALASTGGALVLGTSRAEPRTRAAEEPVHLVGLDAGTGQRLWDRVERGALTRDGSPVSHVATSDQLSRPADAVDGVVALRIPSTEEDPGQLLGIDARTGEDRWRTDLPEVVDGCRPRRSPDADGGVALPVLASCDDEGAGGEDRHVIAALDPATGEVRWSRRGAGDAALLEAADGITAWPSGKMIKLLGRDGRSLGLNTGDADRCRPRPTGDRVVLLCWTTGSTRAFVVDPATGELVDSYGFPLPPDARFGGGRAYHLSPVRASAIPIALTVLDLMNGHETPAVLPARAGLGPDARDVRLALAAGHRLFVTTKAAHGKVRLTAAAVRRRTPHPGLGGVAPKAWPDPCALLPVRSGVDESGESSPESSEPLELGEATVPATVCSAGGDEVRVDWVASSAKEADALLAGSPSEIPGVDERDPGDPDNDADDAFRVGRYLLHVDVLGGDPRPLVAAVATRAVRLQE